MPKQMTGAERRQWIEKLLEQYAPLVWTAVTERCVLIAEREDAFIYVFILAIARLNRNTLPFVSERWITALVDEAMNTPSPRLPRSELEELAVNVPGDAEQEEDVPDADPDGATTAIAPPYLLQRAEQMMRANVAMQEAMRHHRGPMWVTLGTAILSILGLAAVGYGISNVVYGGTHRHPSQQTRPAQNNLPRLTGDLPVTPLATYPMSGSSIDLAHVAVGNNSLYVNSLVQSTKARPRIETVETAFATNKKTLFGSGDHHYNLDLVEPSQHGKSASKKSADWKIDNWRVNTMGNWLVTVVSWTDGVSALGNIVQVYALNTTNRKYSLVDTLSPQTGVANRFVVAVGAGEVAVQSSLDDGSGAPPVGLPIELYQLKGTDPQHAWVQHGEIPASFGLMEAPVLTSEGIVFQGIAGKPEEATANAATWYELTRAGNLTRLYGPPIDGQAHWAVRGNGGTLWWVETTPDPAQNQKGYQVSMEPLAVNKSVTDAKNLNSSVTGFTVDGAHMLWMERVDNQDQLVIVQVD